MGQLSLVMGRQAVQDCASGDGDNPGEPHGHPGLLPDATSVCGAEREPQSQRSRLEKLGRCRWKLGEPGKAGTCGAELCREEPRQRKDS